MGMKAIANWLSISSGISGALLCLTGGISRLAGGFHLGGFEASTLFLGGIGLMVFASLLKLQLIQNMIEH